MDKVKKIKYCIDSLCIYNLRGDKVLAALEALIDSANSENVLLRQAELFNILSVHDSLRHYVSKLILTDDNVFTRAAAAGNTDSLGDEIISAVKSDLKKLDEISKLTPEDISASVEDKDLRSVLDEMPGWKTGKGAPPLDCTDWNLKLDALSSCYFSNGYGIYAEYSAFTWRNGKIVPITSPDPIKLNELKNYEKQRNLAVENTVAFLDGLPANNVLLYGDRGTGKSSTVHAILNEFKNRGLRMIEISKGDINDLTRIRESISYSPMKFIIYIDDLSFDSHDDSFGELKAALEGSLSARKENIVIYATSNRRHLIKENFSDRENDVNRSDTMQEELSLSDRFGLSITFMNPDKKEYLDIAEQIISDRGFNIDMQHFLDAADQWARRRGGRSPRCAKQFADYVESCIKRGVQW